ncbi:tRNA(His) 5'-end guanylyltransferase [Methanohalophilus levihalophilus]|uniref:tRNA(His) guanylyltransferase Thg1 family protein n=1 Tax=Methanohalophilus levihalophilus TaxID=1431282 RepID=UPI001AEA9AE1|nr:tRNA(His) guanylyltransferase Thg1 family protein [Methanohalophilus levihalophilus]MBP2030772.1 tRNA(His) 5'-end guanylyltransferase [Methanohalophilus levihalophilus]
MKDREIYSDLRCAPPIIIRIDGRNFKNTLNELGCEKPYDKRLASSMAHSLELLFTKSGLNPSFAYTFSDEASIVFADLPFNGRVEKLDSIIPSFLSSAFTLLMELDIPISFDSRIVSIQPDQISSYMEWRQAEAWRNCVFSYGFYTLVSEGITEKQAFHELYGKKSSDIHELLFQRGINIAKVSAWQRRGIAVHREEYPIEGFDPSRQEPTVSTRSRITQQWELPLFSTEEGADYLKRYITLD